MFQTKRWQQNFSFGGRIPWAVGLLMSLTVLLSLITPILERHGRPLLSWIVLSPADVWHGQIWRLFTWPFIERGWLGLLFAFLSLYWFATPLAQNWGSARLLAVVGGTLLTAAGGTCLIALVDPDVMNAQYASSWPMITGIVVMWGLMFHDQVVRLYMVLPIRGYWMAWGTVAITVVIAIYNGWAAYVPELLTEAAVLAWLYRGKLTARWTRARLVREAERRQNQRAKEARRRGGVVVDLRTGEPPRDDRDIN